MNRLIAVVAATLVLVGCTSTPVQEEASIDVSYPVQTEEDVQNNVQNSEQEDVSINDDYVSDNENTQDSAENDDLGEPNQAVENSRERAETESGVAPIVEAAPVVTPTFNSTLLNYITDINTCKIRQTNRVGYENKGFPYSSYIPATGNVKIALVAMDFENAVGSGSVAQKFGDIPAKLESWSNKWSFGNMTYDVQLHPEWIRAPKSAEWYNCPECHGQGTRKQSDAESLAQIISAIDPYYDLSGIDFIGIIVPPKADEEFYFGIYGLKTANTNEGSQRFSVYGGLGITEKVSLWDLFIHEILHFQGFVGHGPGNGTEYGIMMMQWGRSKAVNIWEGFVAGWYGQNEVACVDARDIDGGLFVELGSIESFGAGYEGLIIKLNSEEALVIEHRKVFGSELTAYRLNVNAPTYRDDMGGRLADSRNWWSYVLEGDGNIRIDKSITYGGVTITNLENGKFQVSK